MLYQLQLVDCPIAYYLGNSFHLSLIIMSEFNPRRFNVCSLDVDGTVRVHFMSDSYDQADAKLDHYNEMFPNSFVDIIKRDVLLNCVIAN